MNWQMAGVLVLLAINLLAIGASWGDLRAQRKADRERQDERHGDNQRVLHEIQDEGNQVRNELRIMSETVARHAQILLQHGEEIERLRNL